MATKDLVRNVHIIDSIPNPSIFNFEIPSFEIVHPAPRLGDNLFPLLDATR
jgi:hypothetical protein